MRWGIVRHLRSSNYIAIYAHANFMDASRTVNFCKTGTTLTDLHTATTFAFPSSKGALVLNDAKEIHFQKA